jgi:hypothetical protein
MLAEALRNQWGDRPGMGPLFRQFNAETTRVNPGDALIEFDAVSIHESDRTIDIATQAYSLQNESISRDTYVYEDGTTMSNREAFMSTLARINTRTMRIFRTTPQATYERLMREAAERRREGKRKGG